MFKKIVLSALAATLCFGGASAMPQSDAATCGDLPACVASCPTAQKVSGLLGRWEAAARKSAEMTVEARQEMAAKMVAVAETCPVGSRLGETLSAVNAALAFAAASSAALAENCPIEDMDPGAEGYAAAKEMKAVRTHMIVSLNRLSAYASGSCGTACGVTCEEGSSQVAQTVVESCSEGERATAKGCPIRIASRIGAAKASFVQARKEVSTMAPEARGKILAGLGELARTNEVATLVPESVGALAEGFAGLSRIQAEMGDWVEANPEVMAEVPKEAYIAFMVETALIDEAAQLLASVAETMAVMQQPVIEVAEVVQR